MKSVLFRTISQKKRSLIAVCPTNTKSTSSVKTHYYRINYLYTRATDGIDEIVQWALETNLHVLIGGPLSLTFEKGLKIAQMAKERGLVVEAGFKARYKAVWEQARTLINQGKIGQVITWRSLALWEAKPDNWYYQESFSGGMPLTHLTY